MHVTTVNSLFFSPAMLLVCIGCLLASLIPWDFADKLPVSAVLCWTALVVALSVVFWTVLRGTRWRAAAGWIALALGGQACSLQLLWVGPQIRLQLFYGWSVLLVSYRGIFLVTLLLQAAIVLWGARKFWPEVKSRFRRVLGWRAGFVLLALEAYVGITIAPGVAQALVGGGFARQAALHATKITLGLLIFGVGGLNLALAAAAIPSDAWEGFVARWQRANRKPLPWLCALWVVVISSLLAWFALNRMPHIPDEVAYIFQAKHLAAGHFYLLQPPDPNALYCALSIADGSKWYSAMPAAGWAFALAAGFWAGVPWLVNPLLGGLAILLSHALVRRLYGGKVADAVALLMAASPWLLFLSASLMPHALSLVLSLIGLVGVERAREKGSIGWAAASGLSFGALVHVRVLEAILVAAVAGLWWLSAGWRKLRLPALATACVAGLLMTGLFLSYNKALTGDAMLPPVNKFFNQSYYQGANRLGFGRDVGNVGWTGLDALPGHGPIDVVMNTNQNLYLLNFELFGWACGSLVFAFLLLAWRHLRSDGLMWGWVFATVGGMSLYWFSGGPDFGPRYWYQMILPVTVLTVRGAQGLAERLAANDVSRPASQRVWAFVVLASLLGLVNVIPWRSLDKYHHYRGMRPDIRRLERDYHFGQSLVLVRGPSWPDYASAFSFNPPTFDRNAPGPIYARELGPESNDRLRNYYASRPLWIVDGPAQTGKGFAVVEGPLPFSKFRK
jgi:hypothetical protein